MNLGEAIKRRREELGLPRDMVADLIGLDRGKLEQVEGGDPRIKLSDVLNICAVLGCKLDELLEEARGYEAICAGY